MTIKFLSNWKLNGCFHFLGITKIKCFIIIIATGMMMLLAGSNGVLLLGAASGAGASSHTVDSLTMVYETEHHTEINTKTFNYYPKSLLTIHSGAYGALNDAITYLYSNPSARVDIRAYAEFSGNNVRNLALTKKRVSDIRNYLILHGISENNITAKLMEETSFLEDNQTDQPRSINNLVEIIIR